MGARALIADRVPRLAPHVEAEDVAEVLAILARVPSEAPDTAVEEHHLRARNPRELRNYGLAIDGSTGTRACPEGMQLFRLHRQGCGSATEIVPSPGAVQKVSLCSRQ